MYYDVFHIFDENGTYQYNVATNNHYALCKWKTNNNFKSEFFDRFSFETDEEFEFEVVPDIFIIKKFV